MEGEKHFLEQYQIHNKPETEKAAKRKEKRTGERGIYHDRSKRIEAYIERLEEIFLSDGAQKREKRTEIFKDKFLYPQVLIKDENFPEGHFEYQRQLQRDRGVDEETIRTLFDEEKRQQEIERVKESQKLSLDNWIDYLTGDDCRYPSDIKLFAAQGILKLGKFDTEKYSFTKRTKETTAPFPEIDREALSIVLGAMDAKVHKKPSDNYSPKLLDLIERGKSFVDMYALAMKELDQKSEKSELLHITEGEWIVFKKGSDPQELVNSLEGKRSNLCIADIGSATSYLNQGNVEVYFSYNRGKQPTVPRIAVAYSEEKGGVYEVRGTYNKNEDFDPQMEKTDVLMDKLKDLPSGESFRKKDIDMKKMTALYNKCFRIETKTKEKIPLNHELTKEDLSFLYEIESPIQGFGYQKDPRIAELRQGRNIKKDIAEVIGCLEEEVSTTKEEALKGDIKFHYGDLNLNNLTTAEGLNLPETINGGLSLNGLTTAEGLNLPETINGYLYLGGLTTAEGLNLPETINGDLYLNSLTTAEGLNLPETINGYLYLGGLTTAEKEKLRQKHPNLKII